MEIKTRTRFEPLKDGVCNIYGAGGEMKYAQAHFDYRTVGSTRFFNAAACDQKIDMMVRTRWNKTVCASDSVVLKDGTEYEIIQAQKKPETNPVCMDLTLRSTGRREVNGNG